jgi:dTDP-glucose 4,6-dehydratase
MKILVTGGAGFIGHHFVDYLLRKTDWDIVLLERLSHSGNLNRIAQLDSYKASPGRVTVIHHDLRSPINAYVAKAIGVPDYIVHFAASTHVDRSIEDPMAFVLDNVVGTTNLLQFARALPNLKLMVNFSTDEVFGPAPAGVYHKEDAPHHPSNAYSATKSAQEKIAEAFFVTNKLPVVNTHTMNNFGERQHPEKFIPKTVRSIMEGKPMPIYATVENGVVKDIGSRVWMHAQNTADAIYFLLQKGVPGEEYNIIGFDEYNLIELGDMIAAIVGKPLLKDYVGFYSARPGHDRRYALDGTKMKNLGWTPPANFKESLEKTVRFTLAHPDWM